METDSLSGYPVQSPAEARLFSDVYLPVFLLVHGADIACFAVSCNSESWPHSNFSVENIL